MRRQESQNNVLRQVHKKYKIDAVRPLESAMSSATVPAQSVVQKETRAIQAFLQTPVRERSGSLTLTCGPITVTQPPVAPFCTDLRRPTDMYTYAGEGEVYGDKNTTFGSEQIISRTKP